MNHYESGGVPLPPAYLRETWCKCEKCGAAWVGRPRAVCSGCALDAATEADRSSTVEQLHGQAPAKP